MTTEIIISVISVAIAITSILVAIGTWQSTRPVEELQINRNAMLECFQILSDQDVKKGKYLIAQEWCEQKDKQQVLFSEEIKWNVQKVREAYNQACALYDLGLLNDEQFRDVYGGTIVSTYKMMKDDIENSNKGLPPGRICKYFVDVANDLIDNHNFKDEPYCPPKDKDSN